MGLSGVSHFLKSSIDVAVIKFVIPADVNGRAGEGLIGPLDAPAFFVDVAGKDDQVDIVIEGRWVKAVKFVMQV